MILLQKLRGAILDALVFAEYCQCSSSAFLGQIVSKPYFEDHAVSCGGG